MDRSNVHEKQIDAVIVSSVVPKVMHSFTNGIKKFVGIEPLIVGPGIKSGISVQLENPRNVGADVLPIVLVHSVNMEDLF